jgi:hypothetical protein
MVDSFSKFIAIMLAVALLFLFPLVEVFDKQERMTFIVAQTAVTDFVDSVRYKGYMTPTMYMDFYQTLHSTGYHFEVEMEHLMKQYVPVYADPADPATFQGEYEVIWDGYYNEQILSVLFPDNAFPIDDKRRIYRLNVEDYFRVVIRNTNRSNATIIRDFLTFSISDHRPSIYIPFGGMVQNEDH